MITKTKVKNESGEYSCGDIGISVQEWQEVLALPKSEQYIDVLLCFLREPDHKSTCSNLGLRYGESSGYYNIQITHFNQMVQKYFNRFEVEGTDGKPTFWPICMQKGWEEGGGFSWQLRDELVEALQTILLTKLVSAYKNYLFSKGGLEACDELYKWRIASDCSGKTPGEILDYISKAPHFNLMDMRYAQPSLQWIWKEKPSFTLSVLNSLFDENVDLENRVQNFISELNKEFKNVEGKTSPGDERTAGCLLAAYNPTKYAFYKRDVYEDYCSFIGEQSVTTGKRLAHFEKLLQPLTAIVERDVELTDFVANETAAYIQSTIYLAHDAIWQMKRNGWMGKEIGKLRKCCYWLAGYNFGGTKDQFQRFLDNQIWEGSGSAKINKEIEQIRPGDIIMLKSCYTVGAKHQQSAIKIKAIGTVMTSPQKLAESSDYSMEVQYKVIEEKEFTNFSGSYRQTIHRVSDDLFTNFANEQLGMKEPSKYQTYIDLLLANRNLILTGAPGTGKSYLAREIAKEIVGTSNDPSVTLTDVQIMSVLKKGDLIDSVSGRTQYKITDVKDNKIYLTGDTITGKACPFSAIVDAYKKQLWNGGQHNGWDSYSAPLARTIYQKLPNKPVIDNPNDRICFVQFHPSYDYSDFVEGLRPKKDDSGNLGFERQDGIFKEFCKKAQKNLEDSAKSQESLAKEMSILEKLETFLSDAVENQTKYKTVNGTTFTIESFDDNRVYVLNNQQKAKNLNINLIEIQELLTNDVALNLVGDITTYFQRKNRTQMDSYQYVICTEVRKMESKKLVPASDVQVVQKKDFVFIIDEINRGELSKIFGELFFSIDPGYRGKSDLAVKTQYQNLVETTDVFAKGFYVPSNVYILGTMNDIDRSVESMDYAMRRRFAWKEVLPESRLDMWEDAAWAGEAKVRMSNLNKAIAGTHGLGKAYQIGPAYFLKLNEYDGDFSKLWDLHISVLLQEYLRGFADADESYEHFREAYNNTSLSTDTAI